uniref:Uncharacterized protein LOC105134874 n=1 Tax=Rhizophora mucronata TaxID=61149 RepID=A0A2P2LVP0_RHIMU
MEKSPASPARGGAQSRGVWKQAIAEILISRVWMEREEHF